jgi:spore coat protein CotH
MVHEALGYEVYAAMGVAAPRAGFARVTLNGRPYGLYANIETTDSRFLSNRFGDASGILYEANYGTDFREGDAAGFEHHSGDDPDRQQLRALIRSVEVPGDEVFYGDTAQVDTSSFLAMLAAGVLIQNWDSYYTANNYRIYWNRSSRRWVFIPSGLDQILTVNDATIFGGKSLLIRKCLASPRCNRDYTEAVGRAADRFEALDLLTRLDAVLELIEEPSLADPRRPYDTERMTGARDRLREFIRTRPDAVRAELAHP